VTDATGNPIAGDLVAFTSSDRGQRFGPVRDRGDGTYAVEVVASSSAGDATIAATDTSVDPVVVGTATLRQLAPAAARKDGGAGEGSSAIPPPGKVALLAHPRRRSHDRGPTFRFVPQPGARFRCQLDDRPYRACASPLTLPKLALGPHVFRVRAVTAAGAGPVATYRFVVEPRRSGHG